MISILVKERLNELFCEIAEAERKSEICKQVLQEIDFNPFAGFKCMIIDPPNGVDAQELQKFLIRHEISPSIEEINILFAYMDTDCDGLISWCEFLNRILSREKRGISYEKEAKAALSEDQTEPISAEAEHALFRVFEQEMKN